MLEWGEGEGGELQKKVFVICELYIFGDEYLWAASAQNTPRHDFSGQGIWSLGMDG